MRGAMMYRVKNMHHTLTTLLKNFAAERGLPASYANSADRWFVPLAQQLNEAVRNKELGVLGIVGCQGSGKSTLAALLAQLLCDFHGLKVVVVSLDDFYHTLERRQQLGKDVHPLLKTRGVPGTHDINLAIQTLDALLSASGEVAIPRFDKARDDRRPRSEWDLVTAPVDLVILEGWCLAARPQPEAELEPPINQLERQEDPGGRWRRYVNHHLADDYPLLFQRIDHLVSLLAPSFDCVYGWRLHQEEQLQPGDGDAIMDPVAVQRFVQHFERVTRYNLPFQAQADVVFRLDRNQQIQGREDHAHG